MSKRIAFFMGSMGRGGAERVVSILSKHYCEIGWNVDICMLLHNINEYTLDQRVNVLDLSFENKNKFIRIVKMLNSIRRYVNNNAPDVLVPFLAKTSALVEIALLGKKRNGFRVVTSERIDPYAMHYSMPLRILVNRSFNRADAVVFQTKRAKTYYAESIRAKSRIIGNPVRMDCVKSERPEHIIITAGRLESQKNQRMLIEAFSRISGKYPEYKLCIYGEGTLRNELENQIITLNLKNRAMLMGNQLDYQKRLAECRIFVLPSHYEGLSNALLEAMMIGLPCISTNCAGSDEVIIDGENGLLVPVGDTDKLEEALDKLIGSQELQQTLSEGAKETAKRFETQNVISAWRKVLEGV